MSNRADRTPPPLLTPDERAAALDILRRNVLALREDVYGGHDVTDDQAAERSRNALQALMGVLEDMALRHIAHGAVVTARQLAARLNGGELSVEDAVAQAEAAYVG